MYAAAPDGVGAQAKEIGGALCLRLDSMPQAPMFNRALGLGLDEPVTEDALDRIVDFLDETRALLSVAPEAGPAQLPEWLQARQFGPGYGWTKFTRPPSPPAEARTDLRVERVETGEAFGLAAARGFEVPELFEGWLAQLPGREGWHCFVAFDGDQPAGAGALYVNGRIGWFGIGATIPEHRGKGSQSAVLAKRIEAATALGCEILVSETGKPVEGRAGPSYRNLVRAGFEPVYVRENYER